MSYAHLFNAPKASGFKHRIIVCASNDISKPAGKVSVMYAHTKRQARAMAKAEGATPWNF